VHCPQCAVQSGPTGTLNEIMAEAIPDRESSPDHDHDGCVEKALRNARRICHDRGLRLTPQRVRVLELIWNSHEPVGAYDILDSLKRDGQKAAPPTVYRALEFLIEADLVHRLDSLNAFVGCPDPDVPHAGQFLICRSCRTVTELDNQDISSLIETTAARRGFRAMRQTLEVQGTCQSCRADP
jgi:Fur family transcriptional regulator, zinc uptake regulator